MEELVFQRKLQLSLVEHFCYAPCEQIHKLLLGAIDITSISPLD
jgi:hypothetical protein